jgi:hypothetical protein
MSPLTSKGRRGVERGARKKIIQCFPGQGQVPPPGSHIKSDLLLDRRIPEYKDAEASSAFINNTHAFAQIVPWGV